MAALPHGGARAASTAIYFLVTRAQPTTYLHRLKSDELFHLYEGGPLDVLLLGATGGGEVRRLGLDVAAGERPQIVIAAGTWFAVELAPEASHCLFGCTVAPGFDFADFELAEGPELAARHPAHAARIARMTRPRAMLHDRSRLRHDRRSGDRRRQPQHAGQTYYFCSQHCLRAVRGRSGAVPRATAGSRPRRRAAPAPARRPVDLPDASRDRARRPGQLPDLRHGARAARRRADDERATPSCAT